MSVLSIYILRVAGHNLVELAKLARHCRQQWNECAPHAHRYWEGQSLREERSAAPALCATRILLLCSFPSLIS